MFRKHAEMAKSSIFLSKAFAVSFSYCAWLSLGFILEHRVKRESRVSLPPSRHATIPRPLLHNFSTNLKCRLYNIFNLPQMSGSMSVFLVKWLPAPAPRPPSLGVI